MKEGLLTRAIDAPTSRNRFERAGLTMDNKIRVELAKKKGMRKRGLDSPDHTDAVALTFVGRLHHNSYFAESCLVNSQRMPGRMNPATGFWYLYQLSGRRCGRRDLRRAVAAQERFA